MKALLITSIVILFVFAIALTVGFMLILRGNAKLEQYEQDLLKEKEKKDLPTLNYCDNDCIGCEHYHYGDYYNPPYCDSNGIIGDEK